MLAVKTNMGTIPLEDWILKLHSMYIQIMRI